MCVVNLGANTVLLYKSPPWRVTELFPIEERRCFCIHKKESGRNVSVDQSQKKLKTRKDKERGEYYRWWRFHGPKEGKDTNSVFLADDVVNDMKRMNPQQLVEFLFYR